MIAPRRNAASRAGFAFHAADRGRRDPVGDRGRGCIKIRVEPGQDGRLWTVRENAGWLEPLTLPPFTADHPRGLLLPRGVVNADG